MSSLIRKPRVVFSVTNCICYDQRVLKIAETVSLLGCQVEIIGRKRGDCCNSNLVPFKTKRFRMIFKKGFLFYKFFNIRLFLFLLFHKQDILVANDLDTLLPNYMISRLKRVPLIYDSHEYFTGVPEIQKRYFVKWVWTSIEKMIFPGLKNVMTVSDSIADKYESEYRIRPITVRNCSRSSVEINKYTRKELGINPDDLLLIYQGAAINVDRGGEELIDALAMTDNVTLLIVGSGDILDSLEKRVISLNLSHKVRFISKQPWEKMMRFTKSADAGLSLDKDTNLNYRFSLSNKLFDYISAGIPVIAGNLHEVKNIIGGFRCGIVISAVTPEEIANAVLRIKDDREYLNKLKQNSVIASETLIWEEEAEKVTELYRRVLKSIGMYSNK